MPALCLPEYTTTENTHTHAWIRITGGIGFHLARFASNSKLVLLQILLPDVSKVSERKTDTAVFVIRHETSISLSLSLYFVSRSTRTNFRIAFSVETRFGSNVTRFAIRDVEGERGQNQAEMEWKKTGGESKEGETGKERGGRR